METVPAARAKGVPAPSHAEDAYWRLDNSAVFLAAIAGTSGPLVYRFFCVFTQPIRLSALQRAVTALTPRFPFFFVVLRYGVFWHYLDRARYSPRPEAEQPYPNRGMFTRGERPLVRILPYGRRLSVEFHHAVTDGFGALTFLRALAAEYLRQSGIGTDLDDAAFGNLPRAGEASLPEEEQDAYAQYFRQASPQPPSMPLAFMPPGQRRFSGYRETWASTPLKPLLLAARARDLSLTEFLSAAYLASLQDLYEQQAPAKRRLARKIIRIQVPVNLRNIFPSRTLRNFFLGASPSIDLRLGHWEFDEIARHVHHQMRLDLESKELSRHIKRNVGGERHPLGRTIFLPLKNLVLRVVNASIGIWAYSGSLSNMGVVVMPEQFAQHIDRFAFTPSRSRSNGLNIAVLSWKETVSITIGSMIRNRDLERLFLARLASLGLDVAVACNEPWCLDEET